jgi:SsrA-binding protein
MRYLRLIMQQKAVNIVNRKAGFNFFISDTYEAGILLTGTEIKSVRDAKASLGDAYCYFRNNELWIKNLHISEYDAGSYNNHIPRRERKLLLNRSELRKLLSKAKEKGTTIVPLRLYINERGYAKLEIGLARGKKKFDKRESMKTAEAKREMARNLKH